MKNFKINKIYNEDCLKTMSKMDDCFIDLIITSPPYDNMRSYEGNNFYEFEKIAKSIFRIIKKGGVLVWVIGDQTIKSNETGTSFKQALFFKKVGFNLFDTMIYLKAPRGAVGNNKTYWQAFEYMFVLSKGVPKSINLIKDRRNKESREGDNGTKRLFNGGLKKVGRGGYGEFGRRTNVWEYAVGKGHSSKDDIAFKHPAIFPEKLVEDHILSWSEINDLVYDPFMGSGTTAKIAKINNRKFVGSEINKDYFKIIQQRINI